MLKMLATGSPRDTCPSWELDPLLAEDSAGAWCVELAAKKVAAWLLWPVCLQKQRVHHWLGSPGCQCMAGFPNQA